MTAITLLEKLGADAAFDLSLLSEQDKKNLEDTIQKAKKFIAMEIIAVPDEEEEEEEPEEETEN